MRGNSNPHSNKQQQVNHNVGASRNPLLKSKHRPMKSQYQLVTQQDQSQRQMLEVYTQPLENSRAHTPTQSMRGTQLQNASPPTTTDINKLYHLFKAQQQIALNGLNSRSNSRSRSRSKKTRDHKENKEYALLKSKQIYDKISSSQQLSEMKSDLDVKKQVLEFLQWQQKQASSNNHPLFDMKDELNYSSLRQLLANDDMDEELSPKFNQMLNDRENFSSILENIELPSNMKRGMKGTKEEWTEPQVRESAVFQPYNHLIVNQSPLSHSVFVSQAPNQQQELPSKAKHSVNDSKKQTEDTIIRDSGIIHKYSNGNSKTIGEMKGQKGRSPPLANINSSIQGSIVSEQPFQNNRGSQQKRSPVQQQLQQSKFANQKQSNFLSKVQSIKSGGGGGGATNSSGNNERLNANSLNGRTNQRSTLYQSPETNYGQDDSDQSAGNNDMDTKSIGGETNVPPQVYSQLISGMPSNREKNKRVEKGNDISSPSNTNLHLNTDLIQKSDTMHKKQTLQKNKAINDEVINNIMPKPQQKKSSLTNGGGRSSSTASHNNQNYQGSASIVLQSRQINGSLIKQTSPEAAANRSSAKTKDSGAFQQQKTNYSSKNPLPPTTRGSTTTGAPTVASPSAGIDQNGAASFKKLSTLHSSKIGNKQDEKGFQKNSRKSGDTTGIQESEGRLSTQDALINKDEMNRQSNDTKHQQSDNRQSKALKSSLIKRAQNTQSTIPLVTENANKLSFGGVNQQGYNQINHIDAQQRTETPFGGVGAVGARYHGDSLIDNQMNAGQLLQRLSTHKHKKIRSGDNWDTPRDPLCSSYDYIDVNLNDAMTLAGYNMETGRGRKFQKKSFVEDKWSSDESNYDKQMKMPNVKANQIQLQKEIGLKITGDLITNANQKAQEKVDLFADNELREARAMLPAKPFYKIVKKDRIQIIDDYHDRCPCLGFRKSIMRARVYINRGAQLIMMHQLFESISISVIIVNSLFLAMDDPLRDPTETPYFMLLSDDIFQYLYTVEMIVKIVSMGFICNQGSYLRDAWNILDFVIISSGYMSMFLQGSGVNLSALRSFRVIRPLRTISSVAGLRIIVSSLINALPLLRDSLLVLLFFFLVFAIAGCQLFTGALKNRCFNEETGVIDTTFTMFCGGGNSCQPGFYCAKSNENPSNGATNFDNIAFSMLQVFQVTTLEGWTVIMVGLMKSVGTWIFIYFYPIVFIGAFFLLNLTLAVIKAKFTEEMKNKKENNASGIAAPAKKKKKLDDAATSSEDDDIQAIAVNQELKKLRRAKNMSPRSRDNMANKLRIDHLIWRLDTLLEQRDAAHKIVERLDGNGRLTPNLSPFNQSREGSRNGSNSSVFYRGTNNEKLKVLSAADKISIFKQNKSPDNLVGVSKYKSRNPHMPNYSSMFHNDINASITNSTQRHNKISLYQRSQFNSPMRNIHQQDFPPPPAVTLQAPTITEGRLSKYNEDQQLQKKRRNSGNQLQVPHETWEKLNWSSHAPEDEEFPSQQVINSRRSMVSNNSFVVENNVHMQNSPKFMSAGFQIMKPSFQGDNTPFSPAPIGVTDTKIIFAGIKNQNSNGIVTKNPSRNSGGGVGALNNNVRANIARQWYENKQKSTINNEQGIAIPKIMINMNQTNENMQTTTLINLSNSDEQWIEENQKQQIFEKITENFDIYEFIDKDVLPQKQNTKKQSLHKEETLSKIQRQRSKTQLIGKHDGGSKIQAGVEAPELIFKGVDESLQESSFQEDLEFDLDGDFDDQYQVKVEQIRESLSLHQKEQSFKRISNHMPPSFAPEGGGINYVVKKKSTSLHFGDTKEEWTPDHSQFDDIKIKDQLQKSANKVNKIGEVSHMFNNKVSYLTPYHKNKSLRRQRNLAAPTISKPESSQGSRRSAQFSENRQQDIVQRGKNRGLLQLFRACKNIKATYNHKDNYQEQFILMRKRALSQKYAFGAEFTGESTSNLLDKINHSIQKPMSPAEMICMAGKKFKDSTIRGKSIQAKQQKLLAESVHFNERQRIMKDRRATFFAHAIKAIGKKRADYDERYYKYILQKLKIKINPLLMDEPNLKKRVLYRSSSTNAVIRPSRRKNLKQGAVQEVNDSFIAVVRRIKKIDDECNMSELQERDIRKIIDTKLKKDAHHLIKEKFEEIPNMEQVLHDRKLKVVVKMKNMKFSSIKDIFEGSQNLDRFLTHQEKKDLQNKKKKEDAIKAKFKKAAVAFKNKDIIVGYQKKILVNAKTFHEELLKNEYQASDEDQDGMLLRIEDEFNYDHRSLIYVTGTISVVVSKPSHNNKILNENYHANIRASKGTQIQRQSPVRQIHTSSKQVVPLQLPPTPSQESLLMKKNNSVRGVKFADSQERQDNNKFQILPAPNVFKNQNTQQPPKSPSSLNLPSSRQFMKKSAMGGSSMGTFMMKLNNSQGFFLSQRKNVGSQYTSNTNLQQSKVVPNPQPLGDKKLIQVLNQDFSQSRIFSGINFKQLPTIIFRKNGYEDKLFKKKKKGGLPSDDENLYDDESETEKIKRLKRVDYFLEREFDGRTQISLAKAQANKRAKDLIEWSGQEVLTKLDPYKARIGVKQLNNVRVWPYTVHGFAKKLRVGLRIFMNSPVVEHGMTLCVIGNTIVLSLDYYGASEAIQNGCATANTFFTLVFAFEMFSRIIAIGPEKWLSDKMNYMDGTIVLLSLVELAFMSGKGALSALRAVRIFRVFRVLRVARLLRGLKSMMQIINVIQRSISSFIYLALLLLLFVFIYALLGMQIFGGSFKDPEVRGTIRYNYDSFLNAFITSFIMLTTENWNQIMFYAFSGESNQALIGIYFVSCIFIGNWMLLNLFLAILLDSFAQVEAEDTMTPAKKEILKDNMLEALRFKHGEDFIEGMDELQREGFNLKADKKNKKKKKPKKKIAQPVNSKIALPQSAVTVNSKNTNETAPANPQANNNVKKQKTTAVVLDESMEVNLDELARRDQENLALRKMLFRGIECEKSCYLFSKQSYFRIICYRTVHHGKFESLIMILIMLSSFKLVFDTYTESLAKDNPIVIYSSKMDLAFQICFTIEMLLKIISSGFVMDENAYLQESWSQMDFFIVMTGLIDTSLEGVDIAFLKVLRLLRILRPLRFLSHSSSMKTLIEALMASIPSIANVGVVIVVVFLMFAILGVNLFAGKLQYCNVQFYKINTQEECFKNRGKWQTFKQHMDNVVMAMMTLFAVSNNEGWPDTMYAYTDASGVEIGPKPGAGIANAFFFIGFVFIGSFFFLNLFTGVLFMNFEKAQSDERDAMHLDGEEIRWVDMMKMICQEKPDIVRIPKDKIRRWCFDFVREDGLFANFIMACIILNIFTMAAIFEGMSEQYSNVLEKINYFFTASFAIECAMKLVAHGGNYFNSAWNKFDFFVVSSSFIDLIMANMSANSLKVIRVGPQLARIMRVMRVSRLFRLLNKYKGLQALIQTITFSLPSVMNAFALLSLVYFIFSVLAVFFFKDVTKGIYLDDYMNFKNFTQSLMMMLRLSTGEDWQMVMFDLMDTDLNTCIPYKTCGSNYSPIFFILFVLIQQYIMVDLFVLIILQQFDLYYLPDDNVLDRFKSDLTNFKYTWKKYSQEFDGFKIRGNDVQKFFKELKGDLGMANERSQKAIERNLVVMNIQADEEQCIYFNELLYKTMKRRYANGRTKKKVLYELELDTLDRLDKIMKEQIFASRKKERMKAVAVNPFLAMMYKSMSFNVWRDIYVKNLPKRQAHILLGLEREISEEEDEENVTNHDKSFENPQKKDGLSEYYCYQTECDDVIIDDRVVNEIQPTGLVTPQTPVSPQGYGRSRTIRSLLNKNHPYLQRGDLLYLAPKDLQSPESITNGKKTRQGNLANHFTSPIDGQENNNEKHLTANMKMSSMMRLQTVNMEMKMKRISKIGEVAPEGEEDQDNNTEQLKESYISSENQNQE